MADGLVPGLRRLAVSHAAVRAGLSEARDEGAQAPVGGSPGPSVGAPPTNSSNGSRSFSAGVLAPFPTESFRAAPTIPRGRAGRGVGGPLLAPGCKGMQDALWQVALGDRDADRVPVCPEVVGMTRVSAEKTCQSLRLHQLAGPVFFG